MKKIFFIIILLSSSQIFAQCKKGNCVNGIGTYDFSWCLYTGEFKNGKPEGKGTMKYDDYSYTGNFVNGLEDGEGLITNNNGITENVYYRKGVKQVYNLVKIETKDYKPIIPQDINCLSGDCINGFGTYQFISGSKYVGNWVNFKMEGKGTFYFTNKDIFEGIFKNNLMSNGVYTYALYGAKYTGTYDANGSELNGAVVSQSGMSIPYVNGKIIIPPKPTPQERASINENDKNHITRLQIPNKVTCSSCDGHGYALQQDSYGRTGRAQCRVCGGCGYSYK